MDYFKKYFLFFLINSFFIQGCSSWTNKGFYEGMQRRECNQSPEYRLNKESCDVTSSNLRSYEEYENERKEKLKEQ
jgi:hypothetical protein